MKQVWVMIGLGVTVAAGAAVLLPSRSAPPTEDVAAESPAPPALNSKPANSASPSAEPSSPPIVHNNFAPIDRGNVPSMRNREGPLRAPEPTRTAEVRRPIIPSAANESAAAKEVTRPVPVTPTPATTTTTGTPRHAAGRNPVTNQPQGSAAAQQQLEQRRQDLENARRQRLSQAQNRAAGGNITAANQRAAANTSTQNAGESASSANNNGAPSLDDILSQNPWLRDYAPGGRYANSTGTRNNTSRSTQNSNGTTNSGNSGTNTGGSNGASDGTTGGGTVVSGNGGALATATAASFKWIPVDNRACGSTLAGFRTNDLYVRLDAAAPILGISTEENPLTIVGGTFFQASGTGDSPPTAAALASSPCTQFDTYLHATGATGFSLLGGTTNNPIFTPTRIAGSLFNFTGVVGAKDAAKFGDEGYYVLFGRLTAATSMTSLTGKLAVETGVPGTNSFRSFVVDLTFDSTVWAFNALFGLPGTGSGVPLPGAFSLTLPAAGATDQSLTPALAWSAAAGAVDYEVTIDTDAAFTLPNTFRTTTTATTLVIPGSTLVNGTPYHWRVVARNAAGTANSTPASATFTTQGTPPDDGSSGGGDDDDDGTPPGENPPGGPPDPCATQAPGITAVWRPLDNAGCTDEEFEYNLAPFATADLYIRMATTNSQSSTAPFSLQFVSAEVSGSPPVALGNGLFFQHEAGGNTRPAASQVASFPCLAFDTYYAIDTGATETPPAGTPAAQPVPQLILPPGIGAFTATGIRGLWVVSGFGAGSAIPAAKDATRFPNDPCGYYVRIGRFTISRGATLGGTLLVAFVLPGTGTTTTAEVTVPNCTACWGQPAPAPPTN